MAEGTDPDVALQAALEHHRAGRHPEAEALCRQVLDRNPQEAAALHLLGVIARGRGDLVTTISCFRDALACDPALAEAHNGLGVAFKDSGDLDAAIASYRRALSIRPAYAEALNNLGNALQLRGHLSDAVSSYERALQSRPDDGEVRVNLSEALRRLDRLDEAEAVLREAIRRDPGATSPWYFLGRLARQQGRRSAAVGHFRRYLERDPNDGYGAGIELAALGENLPPRATPEYVQAFYAERAKTWDSTGRNPDYRGHDLVLGALADELRRVADPVILDVGCGTGVLGERLRPYTRRIDGIDLSPHMVAHARDKRVYDRLQEGDLVIHMQSNPDCYDIIVGAAVLIHFGDLGPPLAAAATALRPGGLFVFTLFHSSGAAVEPTPFKCYAHDRDHVHKRAGEAGVRVERLDEEVHEFQDGHPVQALVAAVRKPST